MLKASGEGGRDESYHTVYEYGGFFVYVVMRQLSSNVN